jgi:oxidoreductase
MSRPQEAGLSSGQPPIRTALVGLGWAARSIWLPRLRQQPSFTVTAAVDPSPAARAAIAADGTGPPGFASLDEVSAPFDLAVVAVPNHLHADVAARLLTAGSHVFLEKPVCLSSGEARRLAAAERAAGGVLLAGSAVRYRADVRALSELAGSLGQIRHVTLSWVRARGVPGGAGWFTHRRLAGGGALVDLGWHLLDVLTLLLGPVTCTAAAGALSGDFLGDLGQGAAWRSDQPGPRHGHAADVEDTARAFLVTEEGISVSLHASWASHEASDVTQVVIEGSGGAATLRTTFGFSPNREPAGVLTLTRDGRTARVPLPDEPVGAEYDRQVSALPALLRDPASKGQAIGEAARTVALIERIYDSADPANNQPLAESLVRR